MNITQALPRISQIVRRCPTQTLIRAYAEATRDFCRQTRWLREDIILSTSAAEPDYALASVDPTLEVIGVKGHILGTGTDGNQFRIFPLDQQVWPLNLRPGRPTRYAYVPEAAIKLGVTPDAIYPLVVTAQLQLVENATTVPDVLDAKWGLALVSGALGYLLDLPGQPWSNPTLAQVHKRAFQAGVNNAKADEQRGFNTGSVRARARIFGTVTRHR